MMQRIFLRSIDFSLLIPVVLLMVISCSTLFSIEFGYFRNQTVYSIIALLGFFFMTQFNYKFLRFFVVHLYWISVVLLIIVFIIGIESRGAVRWVDIFGVRIQFSEILKPVFIFCIASFLAKKESNGKNLLISGLFLSPAFFLITLQPDLGNALIYAITMVVSFFIIGFPYRWFLLGLVSIVGLFPVFWNFLHGYQRQRIMTFVNPTSDPLGISYNVIQSMIAVGSGMFFGKGLQEGTQSGLRFLPERHTDFIFATFSEGLGFFGSVTLVAIYCVLLLRIISIFYATDDRFCKIFAVFTFSLLLVQFFVNVGMNIGIVPVVGVTLPFVSYGGSSLLANCIHLGMLSAIYADSKKDKVLSIR